MVSSVTSLVLDRPDILYYHRVTDRYCPGAPRHERREILSVRCDAVQTTSGFRHLVPIVVCCSVSVTCEISGGDHYLRVPAAGDPPGLSSGIRGCPLTGRSRRIRVPIRVRCCLKSSCRWQCRRPSWRDQPDADAGAVGSVVIASADRRRRSGTDGTARYRPPRHGAGVCRRCGIVILAIILDRLTDNHSGKIPAAKLAAAGNSHRSSRSLSPVRSAARRNTRQGCPLP